MKKRIYLDNAAATPVDPKAKKAMDLFWEKRFGNPSGIYEEGRDAREALNEARLKTAEIFNASPEEIIFTSGGTESNNLAIFGVQKGHIITTKIEHKSVLEPCGEFDTTYLSVGKNGIVDPKNVKNALRKETVLVSIMYANNEIGTIQPIAEIRKVLKKHPAIFHTDACQATNYLEMNVEKLGVDLMTVNGSKAYGPKGVGLLYVKKGVKIKPLILGGGQESGIRSGTENMPLIAGFTEALKITAEKREKESKRLTKLRNLLEAGLLKKIPRIFVNGDKEKRLPNNLNVSILGAEGEAIVLYLDTKGIACSTGSACTSKDFKSSHVISAIGKPHEYSHGSIRFSLGRHTTKTDVFYLIKVLPEIIKKLRSVSAL